MIASLKKSIRNLLLPHESNNHRSRFLHLQTLLLIVVLLVFSSFAIDQIRTVKPEILGISHNVTLDELFLLTNQKRIDNNLPALSLNTELSQAAEKKADDMFAKDYWAHNAPDGTTPWVFIKASGYNYIYAGENLARGYANGSEVVNAWMESPSHRQNMLSVNYEDVGFAVRTGTLGGEETVLVVQEFGGRNANLAKAAPEVPEVAPEVASSNDTQPTNTPTPTFTPTPTPVLPEVAIEQKPLVNSISFASNSSKALLALFIGILTMDLVAVERKKVVRFVGHNLDHILFLAAILGVIAFLTTRAIL